MIRFDHGYNKCILRECGSKWIALMQAQQEAAAAGMGADPAGEDQAAKRQAALTACGLGLLRSLERALDLSQLCSKAMSDAAERLSSNGGQVRVSALIEQH